MTGTIHDREHQQQYQWAPWLGALLLSAIIGIAAFNAGVSHGLAANPAIAGAAPGWYPYLWFHPFGFVFPLFVLVFFWFVAARLLFWGGRGRGRRGGWHTGPTSDVPPAFEHWHRQAHEKMTEPRP